MATPSQLLTLASEFGQADPLAGLWAEIYLLQNIAGNTMTPAQLLTAASEFGQFDELSSKWAVIYLLSQIQSGGTVGGIPTGAYAGAAPNFTPSTAGALAIDSSTGKLWAYFNGNWTFTGVTA